MNRYRLFLIIALIALLQGSNAFPQETVERGGFVGYGIAPIIGGDIPGARQNALIDAQKKSIITAVGARAAASVLTEKIALIERKFFNQPDRIIQRFKILHEGTVHNHYRIVVQAFLQEEVFEQELADIGVIPQQKVQAKILLLIAERRIDRNEDVCWWTMPQQAETQDSVHVILGQRLWDAGFTSLQPDAVPSQHSLPPCIELSPNDAAQFAASFGAAYVLSGRAVFSPAGGGDIQCTIQARLIDTATQATLVQAAASALGRYGSAQDPAVSAADKACAQLAQQVAGSFFEHDRSARTYTFRLLFPRKATKEEVQQCMHAFAAVIPGLEVIRMQGDEHGREWEVQIISTAQSSAAIQEKFGVGVPGYVSKIVSVNDQTITMRVTPITRRR